MRSYELMFLLDPRLTDEETARLTQEYKDLLAARGAEAVEEEGWGKRKLAYPLQNLNEATYVLFTVRAGEENPFPEVEQRMQQSEQVLRYLTVRTDSGRLRHRGGVEAPAEEAGGESEPAEPRRSRGAN